MKKLFLVASSLFPFVLLTSCDGGNFKAGSGRSQEQGEPEAKIGSNDREIVFSLAESSSTKLDMVWVIDNSGSMANEIDHVRKNFDRFLTDVANLSDFKLALLSEDDDAGASPFGIGLDRKWLDLGYVSVNSYVGSSDPLLFLSTATCGQSRSQLLTQGAPCDLSPADVPGLNPQYLNFLQVNGASDSLSELKSFYREGAKRTFVFVTDDDSTSIDASKFLRAITSEESPIDEISEITAFGFVGTGNGSCDVTRVGTQYIDLANQLGGKIYDICEPDWASNFGDLTKQVQNIVRAEYTIDNEGGSIIIRDVLLDNQPLSQEQYSFSNNGKLEINPDILSGKNQEIVVRYAIE